MKEVYEENIFVLILKRCVQCGDDFVKNCANCSSSAGLIPHLLSLLVEITVAVHFCGSTFQGVPD